VCGHSGCGGCVVAHGLPDPSVQANDFSDTPLMRFIDPIVRLRHAIEGDCSVDKLIEENVKRSVDNVCNSPVSGDQERCRRVVGLMGG
jgi:carbonic anhydrase